MATLGESRHAAISTVRKLLLSCIKSVFIYIQVNEKFYILERVYRDCIKRTRDKIRIHCIPHVHQAFDA